MINLPTLYLAICLVESGNNPGAIGRHGERGAAQISRPVWKQQMRGYAFYRCSDTPMLAKRCAMKHLRWLVKNGVPETPFCLSIGWHSGLSGYWKCVAVGASKEQQKYADRVWNTYLDLLAKSKRGSKPSKP